MIITLQDDLDAISAILNETLKVPSFKRDYDETFAKIARILCRYGMVENAYNLRFRFILCMQEFFDNIPQDQWHINDPAFVKQYEDFTIVKFREWIIENLI